MLRRLGEREKYLQVLLEARSQRRVGKVVASESLVGHRKREHVREDSRAQVFEWHAQGPQTTVAAGQRGRRGEEEPVARVERLWPKARSPVDQVFNVPGIEPLYSGDEMMKASFASSRLRSSCAPCGIPLAVSTSPS